MESSLEVEYDIFRTVSVTALVILSVASLALNSFCLYVIKKSPSLSKKAPTVLIINLLVLQIFQAVVVLPFYIAKQTDVSAASWHKTICNGFRFSYMVAFFGTCLGVLLTSIDRFLAVYWIVRYKGLVTKCRVTAVSIASWVYILTLCAIPFAGSADVNMMDSKCMPHYEVCDYNQQKTWTIAMLCINTALPFILMVLCYRYVIRKVKFIERRLQPRNSQCFDVTLDDCKTITLRKKDLRKHKKITSLALILCTIYALLWLPSVVYYGLKHTCPSCFQQRYKDSCWSAYTEFIIKYIAFLNALVTPLIYCFYQKEFRKSAVPSRLRRSHQELPSDEKRLIPAHV